MKNRNSKFTNTKKISKKRVNNYLWLFLLPMVVLLSCNNSSAPQKTNKETLEQGFLNPPNEAKPRVWWHWMNGNITKEGIRADLEWMNRVGIGGFQNFDAGMTTSQVVDNRLIFMTPEWKDAFGFTTQLADSIGLEMAIAGSPGWSESGGPWVTPREAMKKVVWSEIQINGGQTYSAVLPHPPTVSGTFQNLSAEGPIGSNEEDLHPLPEYYNDISVIAYQIPENDFSMQELQPKITSSGGNFNLEQLTDGDLVKSNSLPYKNPGEKTWIQYEFTEPVKIQSLTIVTGGGRNRFGSNSENQTLEASNDGVNFKKVINIAGGRATQKTLAFPAVTAKYFRVNIITPRPSGGSDMMAMMGLRSNNNAAPSGTEIMELVLNTRARINRFEDKAGFATATDLENVPTPVVSNAISKDNIIDITSNMDEDGTLNWEVPEGKWNVIRLGYSLTGRQNHPASPEATGFEVDKLNPEYVKNYFTNYLDQYKDATNGLMGKQGLQFIITDSWEAGTQNWTDNMVEEFQNRRGYNIFPWLPALVGNVVSSAKESDQFLWDYRKTLAEMVAEYHYDKLTEILDERQMGRYTESHEGGRALIGDGMEVKRNSTVPMSATWTPGGFGGNQEGVATRFKADVRESASVAHIYGKKFVAAESLTAMGSDWAWSPELLKPVADMELASGLNRFVIHTSVHQPLDNIMPGLSLGPFGQWFNRHETWAEQADTWINYLARSSYMLQQGKYVADIAYLYGEDHNITELFGNELPNIPQGFEYDFVNADIVINNLRFTNGSIISSGGMNYNILALDKSTQFMTLSLLQKIEKLVEAGASVVGPKPLETPSLGDDSETFAAISNKLWKKEKEINKVGEGKVYAGFSIQEVLEMESIAPDFIYSKPNDDTELLYVHRKLDDSEFYWVNNRNNRTEEIEASFRIEGMEPEIWHPETGIIEKPSFVMENGRTTVSMKLVSNDAVFVVFRNKSDNISFSAPEKNETLLMSFDGPWEINFHSKFNESFKSTFETLTPWNENTENNIKYFSGTGTYSKTIDIPAEWLQNGEQIWLDLGEVENLAEVVLNKESLGTIWKKPFKVEISDALKEGDNKLEIKVTNLWVNRLIGDQQPDVTNKKTFTSFQFYNADSELKPSGLLGPVQLISVNK